MSGLVGAHIVLGVSGGIAAYKAIEVCRLLSDAGAVVAPVLTADAQRFVTPLTFAALTPEPVRTSLFDAPEPSPHTHLARWADLIIVAPATARAISGLATGRSDDLLQATLLMASSPVLVCPAMHTEMWGHAAVVDNVATIRRRGTHVLDPEVGRLAGGDVGAGRLAEPAAIVAAAHALLATRGSLVGRRVVVTAGGTREAIDPVRFIGNRSSGKQGHAIADEAVLRGAAVTLITTVDRGACVGVDVVRVESAAQMQAAVEAVAATADVVVMAAAVADFRPEVVATRKIKKDGGAPEIRLVANPDIIAALGAAKPEGQVLVGFAAETDDLIENATGKLARKRLDLIVANDVGAPGVGFEHDTNAVTILRSDGTRRVVDLDTKAAIAVAILDEVERRLPYI